MSAQITFSALLNLTQIFKDRLHRSLWFHIEIEKTYKRIFRFPDPGAQVERCR